jgi:hypothetical protein
MDVAASLDDPAWQAQTRLLLEFLESPKCWKCLEKWERKHRFGQSRIRQALAYLEEKREARSYYTNSKAAIERGANPAPDLILWVRSTYPWNSAACTGQPSCESPPPSSSTGTSLSTDDPTPSPHQTGSAREPPKTPSE